MKPMTRKDWDDMLRKMEFNEQKRLKALKEEQKESSKRFKESHIGKVYLKMSEKEMYSHFFLSRNGIVQGNMCIMGPKALKQLREFEEEMVIKYTSE